MLIKNIEHGTDSASSAVGRTCLQHGRKQFHVLCMFRIKLYCQGMNAKRLSICLLSFQISKMSRTLRS